MANSVSGIFPAEAAAAVKLRGRADEVALFTGVAATLKQLPGVAAAIFHGPKHQVLFRSERLLSRQTSRTELSDLAILAFKPSPNGWARLTFLQNKYHRQVSEPLDGTTGFDANLEQWELLAFRPTIWGVDRFNPPEDILAKALLGSVGSFGVFFDKGGSWEMQYCAADLLVPAKDAPKNGKLCRAKNFSYRRSRFGLVEVVALGEVADFCAFLLDGKIGTPLHHAAGLGGEDAPRIAAATWILGEAALHLANAAEAKQRSMLDELHRLLLPETPYPQGRIAEGGISLMVVQVAQ